MTKLFTDFFIYAWIISTLRKYGPIKILCLDLLRRGLALGSGPDEKVASDFTSVPDPSARRLCGRGGGAQCEARPQCEANLRQRGLTPVQGEFYFQRSTILAASGSV